MKNVLLFLLVIVFGSCNNKEQHTEVGKINLKRKEIAKKVQEDSIVFVNDCSSDSFISILEENTGLEENGFILTIKSRDGKFYKTDTLNVRPSMSRISYCTEDYIVVGFPCGGPCSSQVFIFTQENRPNEQFDYSQRVYSNPNIIAHIQNEEFEKLIIHNLENGKELKINISDANLLNYGQMDTLFMIKNNLVIEYPSGDDQSKKKIVNLESILK